MDYIQLDCALMVCNALFNKNKIKLFIGKQDSNVHRQRPNMASLRKK